MNHQPCNCLRHAGASLLLLALTLVLFEWLPLDVTVQRWLYNDAGGHWLLSKDDALLQLLFYNGPKFLVQIAAVVILVALLANRKWPRLRTYLPGLRIVLASMILVPLTVGLLKATTNMPCPKNLSLFNGTLPHLTLLDHLLQAVPYSHQRCFPAGHASGAFALLSLVFLFRSRQAKRRALMATLSLAWVLGLYKMAIGDHFLSHTIASMLLAWMLINLVVWVEWRVANRKVRAQVSAHNTVATAELAAEVTG
ncbi:phosphatase PAP2 family protein [Pseudomaricurvus sp. HS19]|uniref:phosphatase PAP2 family protein n=1 Tax=Pseudomaricurvus sp. HS19 TaxID=2692626 RepID=UPI00136A5E72|nr:phosphatase PAP2 family protein [Pseudomaricurvus sp. HS19]MYM63458.1 phosphatase PAP2 family protein [Pseudomaricurvus sp. HS19]